jgi:hypothetical protein
MSLTGHPRLGVLMVLMLAIAVKHLEVLSLFL